LFIVNFIASDNALKLKMMIYQAVKLLAEQLNNHLKTTAGNASLPADFTQLRNVAQLTDKEIRSLNNVLVTLVNVAEDIPVKNMTEHTRAGISQIAPRYLSLYVLFSSCVYNSYQQSLINLSYLVDFFLNNSVFTKQADDDPANDLAGFRLTVDSYSPGFEESNNLWTSMGGKQFPHMLYRVRLVEIAKQSPAEKRGVIKQFELKERLS
jgi:hypothetical protein